MIKITKMNIVFLSKISVLSTIRVPITVRHVDNYIDELTNFANYSHIICIRWLFPVNQNYLHEIESTFGPRLFYFFFLFLVNETKEKETNELKDDFSLIRMSQDSLADF